MFIDRVRVTVTSGHGGHGIVSFRHEKFIPRGGPDGGKGGKGGSVIIEADTNTHLLRYFKSRKVFKAENGFNGSSGNCTGKNGKDLRLKVPPGTIILDDINTPIYDLYKNGSYVICEGGKGGLGNSSFATASNRVPRKCQAGVPGTTKTITLQVKLIGDVGILGFPNVGKSTFIRKISESKPEISNYPFTTINPHLGMLNIYDKEIIFVDIPGIVNGASSGRGLGLTFLSHVERSKMLLVMLDASDNPVEQYAILMKELKSYGRNLTKKRRIIALNKIDLFSDYNQFLKQFDDPVFPISAICSIGIDKLIKHIITVV